MTRERRLRPTAAGFVAAALVLLLSGTLAATDGSRDIRVQYRNIKLVINGRDAPTTNEPFIYEGRVYVPVRVVSETLGATVNWDDAGSRVLIDLNGAPIPPDAHTEPATPTAGWRPFPDDHAWNRDVSRDPVDPNSARLIASIGLYDELHPDFGTFWDGGPIGIPYVEVPANQPLVPIEYTAYGDESDPGPMPIPPNAPIEGGPNSHADRHVLVVDRANGKLYELYKAYPVNGGALWRAESGAIWDLKTGAPRPLGWTSADAAGLPIFPGLVRYDEVEAGVILHAIRFTAPRTRQAFVAPASHWASWDTSPDLPPMGMRVRLKKSVDISRFSPRNQVILKALQTYGAILADNGAPWFITGTHDLRWDDEELSEMKQLKGRDFEVVKMGPIVTPENSGR